MKNQRLIGTLVVLSVTVTGLLLTGCGHSISSTFTGKSINVGYNPNTSEFGIQYKDGTLIASATKENTSSNIEINNSTTVDENGTTSTNGVTKFRHETKSQINGYFVDALEAGATADELMKNNAEPKKNEKSTEKTTTPETVEESKELVEEEVETPIVEVTEEPVVGAVIEETVEEVTSLDEEVTSLEETPATDEEISTVETISEDTEVSDTSE